MVNQYHFIDIKFYLDYKLRMIHKAAFFKRLGAGLFDLILLVIATIGILLVINYFTHFDSQVEYYTQIMDTASEEELSQLLAQMILKIVISVVASVFLSYLILEFAIPLILDNGMTIGKKFFGIAVMSVNQVKLSGTQLFARSMLGKFAVEVIVPAMLIFNITTTGRMGLIVITALCVLQAVIFCFTDTHRLIHDVISLSVTVDYSTQRIFGSYADLVKAKEKEASEKAEKAKY